MEENIKNIGENTETFKESYKKLSKREIASLTKSKTKLLEDFGVSEGEVQEALASCTNKVQVENACRQLILAQLG